jgi:hypothetical protein
MTRLLFLTKLIILTACSPSNKTENSEQAENQNITTSQVETIKVIKKSKPVNCTDFDFHSAVQQADSLLLFLDKAKNSCSANKIKWEQKFFCAFPNSFKKMRAVFGYDDEFGAAPLYDHPVGENVIQYFSNLESISDAAYYDKYVRINIDGTWETDNIREAFYFANRLTTETENVCKVLSSFSDKEIKSVFQFIFDGPHPKNDYNDNLYKNLYPAIDSQDKRLSRLLTDSYKKIMAEDEGHEH